MPALRMEAVSVGHFYELSAARNVAILSACLEICVLLTHPAILHFLLFGLGGRQQWWMTISSRPRYASDSLAEWSKALDPGASP